MPRNEEQLEKYFIDKLKELNWSYIPGNLLPRTDFDDPLIISDLLDAIRSFNKRKGITEEDVERTISELRLIVTGPNGAKKILEFFKLGVPIKYEKDKVVKYTTLFDFINIQNNKFVVSNQVNHTGAKKIRNDIILYINGIPVVNIELKDPTNPAESWENAFYQIKDYEKTVPELYKYVQIGVAAEASARYFPIVPWQDNPRTYIWRHKKPDGTNYDEIDSIINMLSPEIVLQILNDYLFIREEQGEITKVIVRYMQFNAVNKIFNRVERNYGRKDDKNRGLIWHWQGSGKTLEIIFAANKFFRYPFLSSPSIYIILDRDDLQRQMSEEYNALSIKGAKVISSIRELKQNIAADNYKGQRGIFIVLIHKFNPNEFANLVEQVEAQQGETIRDRKNIICLIDEGHRSHSGVLAAQMKNIFQNAFFFAFTGTPVAKKGANTYDDFSYPPEEIYLDKYFIEQSIEDGYTTRILHEPHLDHDHLNKENLEYFLSIEEEEIDEDIREDVKEEVRSKLNNIRVFHENPDRIDKISADIAEHFKENVDGKFKALVVAGSRLACVRYKSALDKHLPSEYTEVIFSYDQTKDKAPERKEIYDYIQNLEKRNHGKDYSDIRKEIITNYKEEELPKILIVTDMLLTGFDAPILQTMYLDKPLKEQRLLQAIARTNRPYKEKEAGLIIDYVGIFKRIEKAFELYEREDIINSVVNKKKLEEEFTDTINKLSSIFKDVKRKYDKETLTKTIRIITGDKETEKIFVKHYRFLRRVFELLRSSQIKLEFLNEYKWLTAVYTYYHKIVLRDEDYETQVKKFYKKTIELIHQETEVEKIYTLPLQSNIDGDFIKKISEETASKEYKASNFIFTLNKFILVDQHKNTMYESLVDRVENLVKSWRERSGDAKEISKLMAESEDILQEIKRVKEKKEELDLTDEEMAMWLTIKNTLHIKDDDTELIEKMKTVFDELEELKIPGWSKNVELKKAIEKRIREFLFKTVKPKYEMDLDTLNSIHKTVREQLVNYESRK